MPGRLRTITRLRRGLTLGVAALAIPIAGVATAGQANAEEFEEFFGGGGCTYYNGECFRWWEAAPEWSMPGAGFSAWDTMAANGVRPNIIDLGEGNTLVITSQGGDPTNGLTQGVMMTPSGSSVPVSINVSGDTVAIGVDAGADSFSATITTDPIWNTVTLTGATAEDGQTVRTVIVTITDNGNGTVTQHTQIMDSAGSVAISTSTTIPKPNIETLPPIDLPVLEPIPVPAP
ncbi:MAG: hypothetical protein JNL54_17260 [Kineosporiaceae bacterium]|nr:hypothetical protein [Kineosporiaceae bacterium]